MAGIPCSIEILQALHVHTWKPIMTDWLESDSSHFWVQISGTQVHALQGVGRIVAIQIYTCDIYIFITLYILCILNKSIILYMFIYIYYVCIYILLFSYYTMYIYILLLLLLFTYFSYLHRHTHIDILIVFYNIYIDIYITINKYNTI